MLDGIFSRGRGAAYNPAAVGGAIGGTVIGGTAGSVLFVGAGGVLAEDNVNLNFNDSTNLLTTGGLTVNTGARGKVATLNGAAGETAYINSFAATFYSYNAELSGAGVWTARGTAQATLTLGPGTASLATDTGLTSGNTFSQTTRFTVDATGLAVVGLVSATTRLQPPSFTVATAPAAGVAGGIIYFSDAAVAPCLGFSNGTVWKRCDNAATTVI